MFGGQITRLFSIKCLLSLHPFLVLGTFTLSFTIVLTYLLRIVEGGIELDDDLNFKSVPDKFKHLVNALWYIYVTFTTIGYGDLTPNTNVGRIIGLVTVVSGSSILSITIITIQEQYDLKIHERKVNKN
jgi:hypothetical protein